MYAAENGHLEVVNILFKHGANIEAKNNYGKWEHFHEIDKSF